VAAQPVKGLGIAAGAKRPGARKAAAAPAEPAPAAQPVAESATATEPDPAPAEQTTVDEAPVKGLGIAKGARPPGKRK
jgi:hypothetical protein